MNWQIHLDKRKFNIRDTLYSVISRHQKTQTTCNGNIWLVVEIVIGTITGTLLFATPFIVYRKRWIIRHFLFVTKEKLTRRKNGYTNIEHFEYDAFISYSSEDEDRTWVHFKLVQELEHNYGFKLCIHHRDFIVGMDIADNIEDAIIKSRKVIAIVSPDFMNSRWRCREIQMTDYVDTNKIIFVMFRDIPNNMDGPRHIALLMATRTYIDFNQERQAENLFWKRLVNTLYKQR